MPELFGCVGLIAIIPISIVLRGWVLSILWRWFMVSAFHLPILSIPAAIGVSCVISMLTRETSYAKEDEKYTWSTKFFIGLIGPFISLGFGWLVRLWL